MNTTTDRTYSKLRRFNLITGFLHLVQGAFMWVVSNNTTYPVFTNYLSFEPSTFSLSPVAELFYKLPLGPAVAIFLLLSAVAHFYLSTIGYPKYVEDLKQGKNPIRCFHPAPSAAMPSIEVFMQTWNKLADAGETPSSRYTFLRS